MARGKRTPIGSPASVTAPTTTANRRLNLFRTDELGSLGISKFRSVADFARAGDMSAYVYACMHIRAASVAKFPVRGVTINDEEVFGPKLRNKSRKHRLYRLLQQPNPYQNAYTYTYMIQSFLDTFGNALVLLDDINAKDKLPRSLWPLDPGRSWPVFHEDGSGFIGYGYQLADGTEQFIPPTRVLHYLQPDPSNLYWGKGKVQYLAKDISLHAALTEYIAQFFNQGAQPSGVLTTDVNLSDEAFERLRQEALMLMQGQRAAHKLAILDNGMSFEQLSATLKDLATTELDTIQMKKILAVFEVPGTKFGLLEFASYAADDMEKSFNDSMESAVALHIQTLNKLAGLFTKDGTPVASKEMEAILAGRMFEDEPTGLTLEVITPKREPLSTLVDSAAKLDGMSSLTNPEKRQAILSLLSSLVTEPDTLDALDKLPAQAAPPAPPPETPVTVA
jgi:HK97 family phage portal protein